MRFTLRQDKTEPLALLFIESEFIESISFYEIVESFAAFKIKKEKLNVNWLNWCPTPTYHKKILYKIIFSYIK